MTDKILILPIIIPLVGGILALISPKALRGLKEAIANLAALATLGLAIILFKSNLVYTAPWAGFGLEFSLRLYHFSAFIILATAIFGFLIVFYSSVFMRGRQYLNQFYAYLLISLSFINGAVLADNLVIMLFFWEGLLFTLFGMIAIGNKSAFKTATKAFIIVGIADVCMMTGIAISGHLAHTLTISKINLPLDTLGSIAFVERSLKAISTEPRAGNLVIFPFALMEPEDVETAEKAKLFSFCFLARRLLTCRCTLSRSRVVGSISPLIISTLPFRSIPS